MAPDEFRSQLESEFAWRQRELLALQNFRARAADPEFHQVFNKSLLLMLYAHYEGFVKFSLDHYARAIGELKLKANEVSHSLAAAAMADVFHLLRDSTKRSDLFRDESLVDTKLRLLAREVEFLQRLDRLHQLTVERDKIRIDTESNLSMGVLRRNLFVLGLNPEQFESHKQPLSELVERRHKLAHGAEKAGIETSKYDRCRDAAFSVMKDMMLTLTEAVASKRWMRTFEDPAA